MITESGPVNDGRPRAYPPDWAPVLVGCMPVRAVPNGHYVAPTGRCVDAPDPRWVVVGAADCVADVCVRQDRQGRAGCLGSRSAARTIAPCHTSAAVA